MAITLFPHNDEAYFAAVSMLESTGKAAVIHPTGTGKSFIGFKLCEDHPDKIICWLSPSEYIYRTQLENLKAASGGYLPDNVRFYTYAKLAHVRMSELQEIKPDFIVLDEFHRCGAAVWGQGVRALLEAWPQVPVLGLSATAVRYLDNQRDMSDELFDGNVASEMSLGEAIVRGILNPPKYVLSVYSYKKSLLKYETRVGGIRGRAVRAKAEELLEELRRSLNMAEGLDKIFDKHMENRTGKYLVFCSDYETMREAMEKTREWFHLVDRSPHVYSIYSEDALSEDSFLGFKQDHDPEHLKLLFCIDALNEGIHVEDVAGVILLRPTVSPIVYKQQIGRALSASGGQIPVIFDVVNNVQNLYGIDAIREEMQEAIHYLQIGEGRRGIFHESFEVLDELGNCLELFHALENTLTASWEVNYLEAKTYHETHGNLLVPLEHVTETGCRLGRWIGAQRLARRKGDAGLTDAKIRKLDAIGMCWQNADERAWSRSYQAAEKYYRENGNLNVPATYVTEDGISLGRWHRSIRDKYQDGTLTESQIRAMEGIGMQWESVGSRKWKKLYEMAVRYFENHCDLNVPKDYVTEEGTRLGIWICSQRDAHASGRLNQEQIALLNQIGMCWDRFDSKWEKGFQYAQRYVREHGDINAVAENFRYEDFRLHLWLRTQRSRYGSGKLAGDRALRLEKLGLHWKQQEALWDRGYEHAARYAAEHGNLTVPTGYECEDGFKLKTWLNNQVARHRAGKMTEEQAKKLEGIGMRLGGTGRGRGTNG